MIRRRGLAIVLSGSIGVLVLILTVFASFSLAASLYVGTEVGDYPTIQEALDAAAPGDNVIVREGTYNEDVTINTPGIMLGSDFSADVTMDGSVSVTAAAGGVNISGILSPPGQSIRVDVEDGIHWPAILSEGSENRVVTVAGGDNSYAITLGDVTANVDLGSVQGAYLYARGDNSTITHSGIIDMNNSRVSSWARGVSISLGDGGNATIDRVEVEAGEGAIGGHLFTSNNSQLTMTGDVVARARDDDSVASGFALRGQTGVRAELIGAHVEGGAHALGIDFNVADEGVLIQSGSVSVLARDEGSDAYGVVLGAGNESSAMIGHVSVEGGALARGVTTTYPPGSIITTDGLESKVNVNIDGDLRVTARDGDSMAYGVDLIGENEVDLSVGNVQVEGGAIATGVLLTIGDNGSLTHSGNLSVSSAGGQAQGVRVEAGENFQASLNNVQVIGDQNAVQGVALNVGADSQFKHEGLIVVEGTSAAATVRGVNVNAQENFSASVGDVSVEGLSNALGLYWDSTDGASLTQTGTIRATTTAAGADAGGASIFASDGLSLNVDHVEAVSGGTNSRATAFYVNVGQGLEGSFGSLTAEGAALARGLTVLAQHDATVQVDDITAIGSDPGSQAFGASIEAQENVSATFGNITATGGYTARGITLTTPADGTLSHTGLIDVTATDADSFAYGVNVEAGNDFAVTVDTATVSGGNFAHGVSFQVGENGHLSMEGTVTVSADGNAHGLLLDAGRDFVGNLKDVTVTGAGDWVEGIAATMEDQGTIRQVGVITAVGRDVGSNVRGVNINAGADTDVSFGDIDVEGFENAIGINANVGNGGTFMQAGTIRAVAMDNAASASGMAMTVGGDFSVTIGDIVSSAEGAGSHAIGTHVSAGDDFTGRTGDVAVTGHTSARGVNLYVLADADVEVGNTDVASSDGSAFGVGLYGGQDARLTLADVSVNAATRADGLTFQHRDEATGEVLDNFHLTHEGRIEAVGHQSESIALGVFGGAGDDFTGVFGDVQVKAKKTTWGVSVNAGARATVHVDSVETHSEDADSETYGVQVSGRDDVSVTLGDVVSRADQSTWAVAVKSDEGLTVDLNSVTSLAGTYANGVMVDGENSEVTVRGDVSAQTLGGTGIAQGLMVRGAVADVTNHGRVYASANNAVGVGFGYSGAAERISFHNLGIVEAATNTGSAVTVNVTDTATVQNEGTIDAGDQVAFSGANSTGSITLENAGTILGSVQMGIGADVLGISETGRIVGNINMGQGADRLVLERGASVEGNVGLGAGDDEATIHYGAVLMGMLDGGAGDDTLTLLGDGASSLPSGSTWNWLSGRSIEQTRVQGGAWQWGAGTNLGAVDVYDAFLRIDDNVSMADLHLHDGALVGVGNVTGNVTNEGGVVSPGHSFGILTISGNYTQSQEGVLVIELDATSAPNAGVNYDQLVIVGGTAVFEDGTTVRVLPTFGPALPHRAEYVIVDGDVLFDPGAIQLAIELPRSLFFDGWLEEGSMTLVLGVTGFDAIAETENQKAVSEALTDAMDLPDTDLDDIYDWLVGLDPDDADQARAAYDSLSGEVYTHLPALASRRLDGFVSAIDRGLSDPQGEPMWKVWAVPYADDGEIRAGSGTASSDFRLSGIVVGADLLTSPKSRIGVSVGAGSNRLTMNQRASEVWGHGHQLGLYGHFNQGKVRWTTLVGYGWTKQHSRRSVKLGDVNRWAEASFGTTDWVAWVEARFPSSSTAGMKVEPMASLGHYTFTYDTFSETGAGETGLQVDGQEVSWLRGRLGIDLVGTPWTIASGTVSPQASLVWVNDFSPVERTHQGRLLGATSVPFDIHGTKAHRSGFEASLGLKGTRGSGFEWSLDYTGEFRGDMRSYTIMGQVSFEF